MKKKVLFIHPDLRGGGAEGVLVNLLNTLDRDLFDLTLLTIFKEGINRERLKSHINQKYIFKSVFRGYSIVQKVIPKSLLFGLLIKDKYDIIVAYLEGVPTRIVAGCNIRGTKLISWAHIEMNKEIIQLGFRSFNEMKLSYDKMDNIVCVSESVKLSLIKQLNIPEDRIKVLYNSIDVKSILAKSNEPLLHKSFGRGIKYICAVGRLTKQKGFERLLEVIYELNREVSTFHLFILGSGELEEDFKEYIRDKRLTNCVSLLGFQKNPYPYIKASDLLVCSSYNEGYSTAVTESIILETPVITTKCSGMNEILGDGEFGLIVENSVKGLYNGLLKLLTNDDLLLHYKNKAIERSRVLKHRHSAKEAGDFLHNI